jgi:hypothetical protein
MAMPAGRIGQSGEFYVRPSQTHAQALALLHRR